MKGNKKQPCVTIQAMTTKKLPLLLMLTLLIATFLFGPHQTVRGSSSLAVQSAAQTNIYSDSLGTGWVDWSWYTNRDLNATSPVSTGSKSIAVTFTNGWAGFYLHNDAGISTTGYTHLVFNINGGPKGNQSLRVQVNQNDSAVYDFKVAANTWTKVMVPLSKLGSPAKLADIFWQDNTGNLQPVFYLDDIALVSDIPAATSTSTRVVTATTAPKTATSAPAATKPANTATSSAPTATKPDANTITSAPINTSSDLVIYADALTSGWTDQSWYTNSNLNTTSPVQSGSKSISVSYTDSWAGFYLKRSTGINTAGYKQIDFYVNGGTSGNQRLKVVANENGNTGYEVTLPANSWKKVSIPLASLGSPTNLTGLWWQDAAGTPQTPFYLDYIVLVANNSLPGTNPPAATATSKPSATNTVKATATSVVQATSTIAMQSSKTPTMVYLPTITNSPPPAPAPTATPTLPPAVKGSSNIYSDSLASGWQDWSWSTTVNIGNSSPVQSGAKSIALTYTGSWGGFYLHNDTAIDTSAYAEFDFWINGGSSGNQHILVQLNGDQNTRYEVVVPANQWKQVRIPMTQFGSPANVTDIYLQDETGATQPTFYVDEVGFSGAAAPTATPVPGGGPSLTINASANQHSISPDIYGMNWADESLAAELKLPVNRWGGNSTTRYNWQNNNANRAGDWFFENIPDSNGSANSFIDQNRRTGTNTIMTIPLIGWTPKSNAFTCGFSVSKYGAQQYTESSHPDCGNGVKPDGTNITGNNPADTSIQIGPAFVQDWIRQLVSLYNTAANGGVKYYNLDNEPMLWMSTHRDVHPAGTSYDEMRDQTYAYASALKAIDPSAKTLGPVLWGWSAYFYSAKDTAQGGSWWANPIDRNAHGGTPFVEWYLQQMKAYEQAHGTRILDYLDLHFYPQESNVALSDAVDSYTQALRLRSTRALWDPNYIDESWINENVRLIPLMHDWVNTDYPGTKLALTEYNWGALNHINGALTEADVLGIFGREGLDLATLWGAPASNEPGAFAFRMYRNYDGHGSTFGDTSIQSASSDQDKLSIYAATRSSDGAMTVMIINKTNATQSSALSLANFSAAASAQVFRYSSANLNAIVALPNQAISGTTFTASYPPNSITLVVIPKK